MQSIPDEYQDLGEQQLYDRIEGKRKQLGDEVILLGHNYQQKIIYELCDFTGDSYSLSREAAELGDTPYVIFCGVSFMAESADILTADDQDVMLPSMAAACPMAGMAEMAQVQQAWDNLTDYIPEEDIIPSTWAVGTEFNLVDHLDREHDDKDVLPLGCEECIDCNAMAQISPEYLLFTLDKLEDGETVNVINVEDETARDAQRALNRMIDLTE